MHSGTRQAAATTENFPVPPDPELSIPQDIQHSQPQNSQCPQKSFQHYWSQTFDVPDMYSEQIRHCREWSKKMERLNTKYGFDCFSSSELDSESDEGEDYMYKHKYETLI